jgi:glycosyltransferase involved in cell wall biosynthesis
MNAGYPLISVLMPCYNCAPFLAEAVECVLSQTLGDFELLIINDGSTDSSADILAEVAAKDHRVRVAHRSNGGCGAALNTGLDLARGKYLARMDADDRTPPERFAKQIAFLDSHPKITVVGGWHRTFGAVESRIHEFPTAPDRISATMLFRNPISHPTVMMRRESFAENHWRYSERRAFAEDYDLWITIIERHAIANMPEVFLDYRVLPGAIGADGRRHWPETVIEIQCRLLARLGIHPNEFERRIHGGLAYDQLQAEAQWIAQAHRWLLGIDAANQQKRIFDPTALSRVLTGRYIALVRAAARAGLDVAGLAESPFRQFVTIPLP